MRKGVVKWFDPQRRFGIIKPDDDDNQNIFVYLNEGAEMLTSGDRVEFEVVETTPGPRAGRVQKVAPEK